jgi:hypothetical protein
MPFRFRLSGKAPCTIERVFPAISDAEAPTRLTVAGNSPCAGGTTPDGTSQAGLVRAQRDLMQTARSYERGAEDG